MIFFKNVFSTFFFEFGEIGKYDEEREYLRFRPFERHLQQKFRAKKMLVVDGPFVQFLSKLGNN